MSDPETDDGEATPTDLVPVGDEVRSMAPLDPHRDDETADEDVDHLDDDQLDERERRQSTTRKAAGPPKLPASAAAAADADEGRDAPADVPPTDPV